MTVEEKLDAALAELRELRALVEATAARPVYDARALRDMGIPQHRAYELLRAHGVRGPGSKGKFLISASALARALNEARESN